jgi:hypothetical protein
MVGVFSETEYDDEIFQFAADAVNFEFRNDSFQIMVESRQAPTFLVQRQQAVELV